MEARKFLSFLKENEALNVRRLEDEYFSQFGLKNFAYILGRAVESGWVELYVDRVSGIKLRLNSRVENKGNLVQRLIKKIFKRFL